MSKILDLTSALTLCTCRASCTLLCGVCMSPTFRDGPCIKRLWAKHMASDAGKIAAQRFNELIQADGIERAIDWLEEQGMPLEPWQATAFRAIMSHQTKLRDTGPNIPPGY